MPTIANASRFETYNPSRQRPGRADSPSGGIPLRIKVAARRAALTRQLAEGADAASTAELALRAAQLTSDRQRRQLARSLRRTITDARQPAMTRALVSIVNRSAVLEADDALQATIARLADPEPVAAKGMAMLERLVTDGVWSPVFNAAEPGTLRRQLLIAKGELNLSAVESAERGFDRPLRSR
jgi:hypothetical protein